MSLNGHPSARAVIFLHIPKTGGQTLRQIVQRQYPPEAVYTLRGPWGVRIESFLALSEARKRQIRLLQGWMSFGLHTHLPQGARYITFLREPIDRAISYYYYILRTPRHAHHERLVAGQIGLAEYIRLGISKVGVDNGQVRLLSGEPDGGDTIGFGECTPALLEQAKANLEQHFSVVGLLEAFDESLLLLRRALGWRMPYYTRQNVGSNRVARDKVDAGTLRLLAEHNRYDLELYQYAQQRFAADCRRQGWLFPFEVRLFRALNDRKGSRRPPARPAPGLSGAGR
jgi:hypothetical protein